MNPVEFARDQRRRSNSFEALLWELLRNRSVLKMKFRRQHPIGPYTADFYCAEASLVIEVDGALHFTSEGQTRDQERDRWMNEQGLRVLRFTGNQIEYELRWVREEIERVLKTPHPQPLSPQAGRGEQEISVVAPL
jgi:very-short-patch-repair endonuclease